MTQNLPDDDNFNQAGGVYGNTPALWIRSKLWLTNPAYTGVSDTGGVQWSSMNWPADSEMTDRYFAAPPPSGAAPGVPFDLDINDASTPCVFSSAHATKLDNAAILRNAYGENAEVQANFFTNHTAPDRTYFDIGVCGVIARVQGGTINPGSGHDTERIEAYTGYAFVLGMNSFDQVDATCDFQILRLSNGTPGVVSLLKSELSDGGSGFARAKQGFLYGKPMTLRFTVVTNGAQVDLDGYFIPHWGADGFNGVPQHVVTYSDTSANRVTGSGRFGIINAREWNDGVRTSIATPSCAYIQAKHTSTGAIIFRDEWKRRYYEVTHKIPAGTPTHAARPAHTLQCAYLGGLYGSETNRASLIFDTAMPGGAAEGLETDWTLATAGTASNKLMTCVSMRPADSDVKQDRSIDAYWDSVGTTTAKTGVSDTNDTDDGVRSVGVVLRESGYIDNTFTDPEPYNGYVAVMMRPDANLVFTACKLYQYAAGFRRQIGTVAITINQAQWYTLRMTIDTTDSPSGASDATEVRVYIDTVQQVMTLTSSGVEKDASGTMWITRSDRITSGSGEGFRVNTVYATPTPQKLYLDNWAQGADSGPDDPDESDQATIVLGTEVDGATGTLVVPGGWPVTVTGTWGRNEHRFEYGEYRYANALMQKPRRVWTIKARAVTEAETDALAVFWNEHHGTQLGFTWVTDEGETVTAHFLDDEFGVTLRAPGVTRFELRLEELFDGA